MASVMVSLYVFIKIIIIFSIPDDHWNIDEIRSHELVKDCTKEITTKYMDYIRETLSPDLMEQNKTAAIDTVYSAMHGVGYEFIMKAFDTANLKV
jgi:phosphomannomutase